MSINVYIVIENSHSVKKKWEKHSNSAFITVEERQVEHLVFDGSISALFVYFYLAERLGVPSNTTSCLLKKINVPKYSKPLWIVSSPRLKPQDAKEPRDRIRRFVLEALFALVAHNDGEQEEKISSIAFYSEIGGPDISIKEKAQSIASAIKEFHEIIPVLKTT